MIRATKTKIRLTGSSCRYVIIALILIFHYFSSHICICVFISTFFIVRHIQNFTRAQKNPLGVCENNEPIIMRFGSYVTFLFLFTFSLIRWGRVNWYYLHKKQDLGWSKMVYIRNSNCFSFQNSHHQRINNKLSKNEDHFSAYVRCLVHTDVGSWPKKVRRVFIKIRYMISMPQS